jgi:tRNA pseudouridine38-40 synthase
MSKQRYMITIAYDGTAYAGWQVQPNDETIQSVLERALEKIAGHKVRIHGSGRTDQGVHARGQVAHFDAEITVPVSRIPPVLNTLIPPDVRVLSARLAKSDFHARRCAKAKEYRYFIWNRPMLDPFERLYSTHFRRPLDIKAMRKAAKYFVGKHDFRAFTANPKTDVPDHTRRIFYVRISETEGKICIAVKGEGFLYKMVRSMVGYLLRAGVGEVAPESVGKVLSSGTRTAKVPTAPAPGLFLWKVWY